VEVKRKWGQRSVTLRVPSPGLLRVSGPRGLREREIVRFIEERMDFVEACQKEWITTMDQALLKTFSEGESCLFLGHPKKLVFKESSKRPFVQMLGDQLFIHQKSFGSAEVQKTLIRFYKKAGTNYLSHLVATQSKKMNLSPTHLSFRSQRSRWGSCSSQGKISLNWRLIVAPSEVSEYVVIHEMAHLVHQNHSRNFWSLVEEHCSSYKSHKKWLQAHHVQFEFLDPAYLEAGAFFESTKIRSGL